MSIRTGTVIIRSCSVVINGGATADRGITLRFPDQTLRLPLFSVLSPWEHAFPPKLGSRSTFHPWLRYPWSTLAVRSRVRECVTWALVPLPRSASVTHMGLVSEVEGRDEQHFSFQLYGRLGAQARSRSSNGKVWNRLCTFTGRMMWLHPAWHSALLMNTVITFCQNFFFSFKCCQIKSCGLPPRIILDTYHTSS